MQNPFIDLMTRWNKTAVEAGTELLQINADAFSKISRKQVELVSSYLDLTREQLETLAKVKKVEDVPDLLGVQAEQFRKISSQILTDGKAMAELSAETCQQVNSWVEKSVENGWSCLRTRSEDKAAA